MKRILTFLLGKEDEYNFEDKLILYFVLYCGLICFVSSFINIWIKLGVGTIFFVAFSTLVYTINFVSGRVFKNLILTKWIFSIYSLFFCDFYWLVNYGSRGSAMYIFPVYYSIMLFVWDKRQMRIYTIAVLLNVIGLFLLELLISGLTKVYPNESARIVDSYAGLLIFVGALATLVLYAKNNYILQYKLAQRSDLLKSAFLANMSHEVRTPLNAIMGFSKLLAHKELAQAKKEQFAHLITDNGNYLMKLVSDILDVSLIDSGQMVINKSEVNLENFFERMFQTYKQALKRANKPKVSLLLDIPRQNTIIETDEVRLEQILVNLLSNAINFTEQGFVKFGYRPDGKNILFFVEDTGIGIKPELQKEVFERFVKSEDYAKNENDAGAENSQTPGFTRGIGIGLSLTRDLVKLLNGEIWVTSGYMEGSMFSVLLPQKQIPTKS